LLQEPQLVAAALTLAPLAAGVGYLAFFALMTAGLFCFFMAMLSFLYAK
jgi:hypothetical protein